MPLQQVLLQVIIMCLHVNGMCANALCFSIVCSFGMNALVMFGLFSGSQVHSVFFFALKKVHSVFDLTVIMSLSKSALPQSV